MSTSYTFEKCPFCLCNLKGISIVLCGKSDCRKIFCSVYGEVYLTNVQDKSGNHKKVNKETTQPVAGCIHCWMVRPLLWHPHRNEPQIGQRNEKGEPMERFHIRLGEIG